jgi:hypothetical protein
MKHPDSRCADQWRNLAKAETGFHGGAQGGKGLPARVVETAGRFSRLSDTG